MTDRTSIRAVCFDLGETLIDESTEFGAWADWLGVPRHTFSAVLGAVIARGQDHRQVFQYFRPGFDLTAERQKRLDAGNAPSFATRDLYPDARPCLVQLHAAGFLIGIAGNQPAASRGLVQALSLPVDFIATSDDWGVEKPSIEFFHRLVAATGFPPEEVLYVGDRLDNDIAPAHEAGLRTAFIRRGPWGYLFAGTERECRADWRIDSLTELAGLLAVS